MSFSVNFPIPREGTAVRKNLPFCTQKNANIRKKDPFCTKKLESYQPSLGEVLQTGILVHISMHMYASPFQIDFLCF